VNPLEPKTPVILLVLVETARLRWFVAAISLDGRTTPLICSPPNPGPARDDGHRI
jgi:hypothetical protein